MAGLNEVYLSKEFRVGKSYAVLNTIISGFLRKQDCCTEVGVGVYQFDTSVNSPTNKLFRQILEDFEYIKDVEFKSIVVQESGLSKRGAEIVDYGQAQQDQLRIVINLREYEGRMRDKPTFSAVRINITGAPGGGVWLKHMRSYAVILHPKISGISIFSGESVPDPKKHDQGIAKGLYVIIDCVGKNENLTIDIVEAMMRAKPINQKQLIAGMTSMVESLPAQAAESIDKDENPAPNVADAGKCDAQVDEVVAAVAPTDQDDAAAAAKLLLQKRRGKKQAMK